VLEGKLGLRIERLLVEELGTRERMKARGKVPGAELSDAAEDRLGELLPDHRRRLEQPLLPLGEAIDPCCEYALHSRRNVEALRGRDQSIRTPDSRNTSRLDQRLYDLLDEEPVRSWISSRSRSLCRQVYVYNWSRIDQGVAGDLEYSCAAKVFTTDTVFEVADTGIQITGARGLVRSGISLADGTVFHAEKLLRDAKAFKIADGENTLLKLVGSGAI
jgi:acyl-CoA dehydrogenase-like protein